MVHKSNIKYSYSIVFQIIERLFMFTKDQFNIRMMKYNFKDKTINDNNNS